LNIKSSALISSSFDIDSAKGKISIRLLSFNLQTPCLLAGHFPQSSSQSSSSNNLLRSISSVTYAHNADSDSSGGEPKVCSTPLLILLPVRPLCAVSLVLY
jgi:hypothetical protein